MSSQNWRALVALVVSIAPNLPGFINSINSSIAPGGISLIFNIAYLFGVRGALLCKSSLLTDLYHSNIVRGGVRSISLILVRLSCAGNNT